MKKNLKKVISAVLSLSLAMSSFVALSTTAHAGAFADVEDTANYAEAINALAALDVLSGYEDGTFLPDNKITRAEVVTMVVAALNMKADAANSGSTTKFDDVNTEENKWAAGYINVGVSQGFISGMSDTEFAPKMNVTYAHVLTMLTRNLGYGDYAVSRGGFPDGYLEAARAAGILTGVTASANDEMTRGQVAQLIWNAVRAPKLDTVNFSANILNVEMEKMDGTNDKSFVTILSDRFDAYVLNITVEDTSKMSPDNLELGNITMLLTGSNDWDPSEEALVKNVTGTTTDATTKLRTKSPVAAGKTDVENYPFSSAKVVATYIDDEWELVYFAPTSKVATKAVDSTLVNKTTTDFSDADNMVLAINKSKTSSSNPTKYKLSNGAKLYVNGVEYCDIDSTNETMVENLLAAAQGEAVLYEDANATGTKYNRVMIDVYALASVSQVTTSGDDVTIRLSNTKAPVSGISAPSATIKISADDVADGELVVTVTKAGAEIDPTALVKNDVVALKYDLSKTIANCKTIEIFATDETVTGMFSSINDDGEYEIAGEVYEAASSVNLGNLTRGTTYTFRLDPMGNLFSAEEEASTTMYAIVEKYYSEANGNTFSSEYDYMEVMTLDGQKKTLYIDSTYANDANDILNNMGVTTSQKNNAKNIPMHERVISYTVKTTGRVNKIVDIMETSPDMIYVIGDKDSDYVSEGAENYNSAASVLGKRISTDATVLNATQYDPNNNPKTTDYEASSLSNLVSTVKYEGFLVHKNTSAAYAYVVITSAGSIYGPTTDFAVAAVNASASSAAYVNEEDVYTLRVVDLEGTETTKYLNIDANAKVYYHNGNSGNSGYVTTSNSYSNVCTSIKKGSAFFYTTNSDGLVDRIDVILNGGYSFETLIGGSATINLPENVVDGKTIMDDDWAIGMAPTWTNADNEIQLFMAPVVTATDNSVTFGTLMTNYVDTNTTESFTVNSDSNIYSYDLSSSAPTNYEAFGYGSFAGIDLADTEENGEAYFSTLGTAVAEGVYDFDGQIQMAFVMVVDGIVTNAIVVNN